MKPIIRQSNIFVPQGYRAITIWPFIFVRHGSDKVNKELINHETIHIKQQAELLVLPFFIWYFLDYLVKFIRFGNHLLAYKNIIFEREAYHNEKNLDYLKTRKRFQYLRTKLPFFKTFR